MERGSPTLRGGAWRGRKIVGKSIGGHFGIKSREAATFMSQLTGSASVSGMSSGKSAVDLSTPVPQWRCPKSSSDKLL